MQALKHIGIDTDTWDVLITHVITNKFDINTRKEWEKYQISGNLPTLNELLQFIAEKCVVLETLEKHKFEIRSNRSSETRQVPNMNRTNNNRFNYNQIHKSHSMVAATTHIQKNCPICQQNHLIYFYERFKNLSVGQRINEVVELKLCKNGLKGYHTLEDCRHSNCRNCNQKQYSVM